MYGLQLGYQASVDWLTAFFTGFFGHAFILEPVLVLVIALLYVTLLGQHVNVLEEAGVSVFGGYFDEHGREGRGAEEELVS